MITKRERSEKSGRAVRGEPGRERRADGPMRANYGPEDNVDPGWQEEESAGRRNRPRSINGRPHVYSALRRGHLGNFGGPTLGLGGFDDGADEFLPVPHDAIARITKDIGLAVFIDRDDAFGAGAAGDVLTRP